jgi:hypothetical protein
VYCFPTGHYGDPGAAAASMRGRLPRKEAPMTDYLPEVYQQFSSRFPAVKEAFDSLGAAKHDAGPWGRRSGV